MATLPNVSNLYGRWRASDLTGYVENDPVGTWPDTSGNGRHLTMTTAAKRPDYNEASNPATIGGKASLSFDGIDDVLSISVPNVNNPMTVFIVARRLGTATGGKTYAGFRNDNDSGVSVLGQLSFNTGDFLTYFRNTSNQISYDRVVAASGTFTDLDLIWASRTNIAETDAADRLRLFKNGADANTSPSGTPSGTSNVNRFAVGGHAWSVTGGEFIQSVISEVIVYDKALTTAEMSQVHSYFQDEYGITVSDYTPPPSGSVAYFPSSTLAAGGWTASAGTLHGALGDADDLTYITTTVGT